MDKKTYDAALKFADKVEGFAKAIPVWLEAAVQDAEKVRVRLVEFAEAMRVEADKQRGEAVWGDVTDKPKPTFATGDERVDALVNDFYDRMVGRNPNSQEWIDKVLKNIEQLFNVTPTHNYEREDPSGGVE